MRFVLNASGMAPYLAVLGEFTKDMKSSTYASEFISIRREGDLLSVQATCGVRSLQCEMPADGLHGDGGFCIPFSKFRSLFAGFSSDIRFSYSKATSRLNWTSGTSKGWLPAVSWEMFPNIEIDDDELEWFEVSIEDFGASLSYVSNAIPKTHNMESHLGVDLRFVSTPQGEQLQLASSDSQRLHLARLPTVIHSGHAPTLLQTHGIVIPSENVRALRSLLGKAKTGASRLVLYVEGGVLRIKSPNNQMRASMQLVPGRFPDVSRLVEMWKEKEQHLVTTNSADLARAVKLVSVYGDAALNTLRIKVKTEGIVLSAQDTQKGSIKTVCGAVTMGEAGAGTFSQSHLADAVKSMPGGKGTVHLAFLGDARPLFVLAEARNVLACLMPVLE